MSLIPPPPHTHTPHTPNPATDLPPSHTQRSAGKLQASVYDSFPPTITVIGHAIVFWKPQLSAVTGRFFVGSACSVQFCSVQFKMVSKRSEEPICAQPRLSEVFANVAFETVSMFGSNRSNWVCDRHLCTQMIGRFFYSRSPRVYISTNNTKLVWNAETELCGVCMRASATPCWLHNLSTQTFANFTEGSDRVAISVNMVLNVHRNHEAY